MNRLVWIGAGVAVLGAAGYWYYTTGRKKPFAEALKPAPSSVPPAGYGAKVAPQVDEAMNPPSSGGGGGASSAPPDAGSSTPPPAGDEPPFDFAKWKAAQLAAEKAAQVAQHERIRSISTAYRPLYSSGGTSTSSPTQSFI